VTRFEIVPEAFTATVAQRSACGMTFASSVTFQAIAFNCRWFSHSRIKCSSLGSDGLPVGIRVGECCGSCTCENYRGYEIKVYVWREAANGGYIAMYEIHPHRKSGKCETAKGGFVIAKHAEEAALKEAKRWIDQQST